MLDLILGIVIIVLGLMQIVKRKDVSKEFAKYTKESAMKVKPIQGIVEILFGIVLIVCYLDKSNILNIEFINDENTLMVKLIAALVCIAIILIVSFALLKKDPNAEKVNNKVEEDEDEE